MDKQQFWSIVDQAREAAGGRYDKMITGFEVRAEPREGEAGTLYSALQSSSLSELADFEVWFQSYRNLVQLRPNAHVLLCLLDGNSLSDDSYDYATSGLVAYGEAVVWSFITEPEALVPKITMIRQPGQSLSDGETLEYSAEVVAEARGEGAEEEYEELKATFFERHPELPQYVWTGWLATVANELSGLVDLCALEGRSWPTEDRDLDAEMDEVYLAPPHQGWSKEKQPPWSFADAPVESFIRSTWPALYETSGLYR